MALALLVLGSLALANAAVLPHIESHMVNGDEAKVGEFPYQVSLQMEPDGHFCGGAIINANYVITASHCVEFKDAAKIKVVAGIIKLKDDHSVHQAEQIIMHEEYNPADTWKHDIALIKVKNPFVESEVISFVPLPELNETPKKNEVGIISGWGSSSLEGKLSDHLQRTNVYIHDHNDCIVKYAKHSLFIYRTVLCANDPSAVTGACTGDSGGPMTVNGKLAGVISWSMGCGLTEYPTIFTRISFYVDWIKSHAV